MAKSTPSIIASLLLLCLAGTAFGQTTTIRGTVKGSSTAQPVTSTPTDADHTGLDVNIVGGGAPGGAGLTDAELRASPVPVSGTVTATGPLTDGQLRATPVPATDAGVGATGDAAATVGSTGSLSAKLRLITSQLDALQTELNQKTEPANTQTVSGSVTANAGTNLNTSALALDASVDGLEGGVGASADAAATVGSTGSLSAKLRLVTTQLDAIQTAVQLIDNAVSGAGYNITQFGGTNVSTGTGAGGAGIPRVTLSNDSSLAANQSTNQAQTGGVATSMNTGVRDTGTQRVTIATNDVVPASQSGTWTMQPGNTPNTSPWLMESIKVSSANNDGACPSGSVSTTGLASNASRRVAYMVANSSNTDDIFVSLSASATTSDFRLAPGQPINLGGGGSTYTGQVSFIANSGTQSLCVMELQ
jgi:hypothetical protein